MTDRFQLTPFFLDQPEPELESLAEEGWTVNRPALPAGTLEERLSALHAPLAERVAATVAAGERPVSLAGDCCAALPVAAGLARAGVAPLLVWLDAHGDFNTPETSPSGFLGGMPLAILVGRGDPALRRALGLAPFPEERVVLADARDLDPGERRLVEGSAVTHLADPRALLDTPLPDGPLWVHLDVDVADPADLPAVLYPAAGGLGARELAALFRGLAARRQIAAVSLSAWSPERDADGRSREVSMDLLQALLGTGR